MKIIYCIAGTCNSGGMERVLANKTNFWVRNGMEVVIITTDQRGRKPFFPLPPHVKLVDLDINYEENNDKGFFNKLVHYPYKQWKHKKKLTCLLKSLRADVVVSMFCNDVSFIWKIKDGSKKVLEIHFSRFKRLQYNRKGIWRLADRFRNRMDQSLVRRYDRFVVLTHEDKTYWEDLQNMTVIPNARTFNPAAVAQLDNKKAIAIGRYNYQKGFDDLIKAWAIVHRSCPDWELTIVGEGELSDRLQQLIDDHNLQACVRLQPPTSPIEEVYAQASILVMSSRYEGLPMVLLEAQAFGLPVVSLNCKCGPKDIITDGKDGFLVPEKDINALAGRIILLTDDSELRKKMGQAAKLNSERFSEPVIMQQWMELFHSLTWKQ